MTRKIARYLNWAQHNTKIFNVGARRRIAAGTGEPTEPAPTGKDSPPPMNLSNGTGLLSPSTLSTLLEATKDKDKQEAPAAGGMDQSSDFFDPNNLPAKLLREKVAMETLDELLDYILHEGGAVGMLDATNSTHERRAAIVKRIREKAGNELGIVFLESECRDEKLLERNMRLKLSGPDYKGMDPTVALEDFKKRGGYLGAISVLPSITSSQNCLVQIYEKNYQSLGDYEEKMGWQYIKVCMTHSREYFVLLTLVMIDGGRWTKGRSSSNSRISRGANSLLFTQFQPCTPSDLDYSPWGIY